MKKRIIVFDFDGTIADTVGPGFKMANDIIATMGHKKLTAEEIVQVRDKSYREIIQAFKVPIWRVPQLLLSLRMKLQDNFHLLKPYEDIPTIIKKLTEHGFTLYILTSNSRTFVETFLKENDLQGYFADIFSEENIFGKARAIKKFLKIENLQAEEIVYIGDEVRDIEACRKAGVEVISVTWGFNSIRILKEHKPDYMANTPKELVKVIEDTI